MNAIDGMACATPGCDNRGKPGLNIVGYGSFATKSGRRRRYRCTVCRGTLSTNTGTAYSGLRCTRREFDQVASLRVEGVSISATARVTGHSRNTVARWLERASTAAKHFNDRMLRDFDLIELQLMSSARSSATRAQRSGCLRPSRYPPACGPVASWGAAPIRNARAVIEDVICRGPSRGMSPDRHRWLRVLRRRGWGSLGVNVRLWSSAQDTAGTSFVRVERRVKIGTAPRRPLR